MTINESIKIINDARSQGKLVIFVGAGVSMNSGLPGWSELIEKYAAALSIEKSEFSQEEYLKIPQYYYNEFKEKIYYQVIINLFGQSFNANPIHKLIFDLNPAHIITTNFDDLIEKASYENGAGFDIVKQDADLPYAQKIKNIIKMHGDLNLRNIVLKEDDYLSYSRNFPLIETFVKSLIATKTVLFIGYRVDDPDIKLIFQWVKNLLGESFNRSYYIDTSDLKMEPGKKYLAQETIKKYYDNRGIHLLHYNDIEKESKKAIEEINKDYKDDIEALNFEEGKKLFIFLRFILDRKNEIEESILDKFYSKIQPYKKIRAIRVENVNDILELRTRGELRTSNRELFFYGDDDIFNFIKIANEIEGKSNQDKEVSKEIYKINEIKSFFSKTGALSIQVDKGISNTEFGTESIDFQGIEDECSVSKELVLFDFMKIHDRVKNNDFSYLVDKNSKIFAKAYCYYQLKEFEKAYETLEPLSKELFFAKEYLFYYITQFNVEITLKSLSWGFHVNLDSNQREKYREKLKNLDLDSLSFNLSDIEKNILVYIKDLKDLGYFYKEFYNLTKYTEEVRESIEESTYSGTASSEINRIIMFIKLFWRFNSYNFLFVEHYPETKDFYKNAINILLSSHSVKEDIIEDSIFGIPLERIRLKEVEYFIIFLIIKNFSSDEIEKLFNQKEITELKLSEEKEFDQKNCRELLFISFNNILNSLHLDNSITNEYLKYFSSFISIFSFIRLTNEEISLILNYIQKLIKIESLRYRSYLNLFGAINLFVYKQTEIFENEVDAEKIRGLLENIVLTLLQSDFDVRLRTGLNFISHLSYLLNKKQTLTINDELIQKILKQESEKKELLEIIILLYKVSADDLKEIIKNHLINKLSKEFSHRIYELACLNKIISPTIELEKKFVEKLKEIINDPKNQMVFPSPIDNAYITATNYVANNDVIERALFKNFFHHNDIFDLFFDPESIDFDNFDLMELTKLNPSSFSFFSKNPTLMSKIKKALEKFIKDNTDNKEMIKIYFKYFVS